jgi:small-conductance mechanosensitive channel
MIYLDRPFTPDDYIHLNDGTFARVESIGWRSTKIPAVWQEHPGGGAHQHSGPDGD